MEKKVLVKKLKNGFKSKRKKIHLEFAKLDIMAFQGTLSSLGINTLPKKFKAALGKKSREYFMPTKKDKK